MKHLLTLYNMNKEHYIREHMTAAGVGIVELSRRLGQTRQNVHTQIDKSSMTLQTLYRIAAALNVPAHLLLLPPDAAPTQSTPGRTAGKTEDREDRQDTNRTATTFCPVCGAHLTLTACCGKKDASV